MVLSDIGEVHNAARPNWPTNQEETRIKTRGLGFFDIEDNSPCQKQKKGNQSINHLYTYNFIVKIYVTEAYNR